MTSAGSKLQLKKSNLVSESNEDEEAVVCKGDKEVKSYESRHMYLLRSKRTGSL